MADIKFSGLPVGTSPIADEGSLIAISEFDGVSTYTSKSYTLTEFRDIIYVMEAEDKLTFDSTGTNKIFVDNGTVGMLLNQDGDNDIYITNSVTNQFAYQYISDDSISLFHGDASGFGIENTIGHATGVNLVAYDSTGSSRPLMWIEDNRSGSFTTPAVDSYGISIGSNNATINTGITNSIVLGGDSITASESDTAYVGSFAQTGSKSGFYGTAPIVQQTSVAVTAGAIHAALVNLGLITA